VKPGYGDSKDAAANFRGCGRRLSPRRFGSRYQKHTPWVGLGECLSGFQAKNFVALHCLKLGRLGFALVSVIDALSVDWAVFQVDANAHWMFAAAFGTLDENFVMGH
jgi:hypothetical protein